MNTYAVEKYNYITKVSENFGGGYTEEDLKKCIKGYKHYTNEYGTIVYTRQNSHSMYLARPE